MASAKRKLLTTTTNYGSTILDMPKSLDGLTELQAAKAWAYFLGGFSSRGTSLGSVRKTVGTAEVIELLESAAEFARKEGGK